MKYKVKLFMSGYIEDIIDADNEEEAILTLRNDYIDFNIDNSEVEVLE